jgi:hypothetical protein
VPQPRTERHAIAARWLALALAGGLIAGCAPAKGAVAGAVATPVAAAPSSDVSTPEPTARPTPAATPSPTPSPSPTPTPEPTPSPTPEASTAVAAAGPYKVNLYRKGDFVSQATKDQCVAGAMQTMLNIVLSTNDRTKARQSQLARLAKRLSKAPYGGTEPLGWARGLAREGAGRYKVVVEPSRKRAIRRGIEAIRATGRPVGLLVWRGAHSWVLHGFETTADPAVTDDYDVTAVWLSDPWYPRISSIWGPSRKPNQRVKPGKLREDYLKWRRPSGKYPGMDGGYVLVIPVDPA